MKNLILFLLLALLSSCQQEEKVTIGYQLMANPWKYLISTGQLDTIDGKKVEFKKFTSGAKVINAMASGDVDIAIAGSTPIAAGMSQGLDIKLLWILEIIGEAEALVVKDSINSISDLNGKKVGVPYGSTTHYHLMLALEEAGLSSADVEVLNLSPPAIVASWRKGEIDAAFVWAPALEDIKKEGKVLLSSKDMSDKGNPTFDGIIGNTSFISANGNFIKSFLNKIIDQHDLYNQTPWKEESKEVETVASFVGATKIDVANALKGYIFPNKTNHPTQKLNEILKSTATFLKSQGKIESVLDSYEDKIATKVIGGL
ncbi:ABC transporter substrate-binding protein [Bacteriovoracaceae bacterium]|nr:ABC transporter substrate-binding protein [Bacteriovoracaceae bacterium]